MRSIVWIATALLLGDLALLTHVLVGRIANPVIYVSLAEFGPSVVGVGVLVAIIRLALNV